MATEIDRALLVVDADTTKAVASTNAYTYAVQYASASTSTLTNVVAKYNTAENASAAAVEQAERRKRKELDETGKKALDVDQMLRRYMKGERMENRQVAFLAMQLRELGPIAKGTAGAVAELLPLFTSGFGIGLAIEAVQMLAKVLTKAYYESEEAKKSTAKRSQEAAAAMREEQAAWASLAEKVDKYRRTVAGGPAELLPSEETYQKRVDALSTQMQTLVEKQRLLIKPWTDLAEMREAQIAIRFDVEAMDPAVLARLTSEARELGLPDDVNKQWQQLQGEIEDTARRIGVATQKAAEFRATLDPTVAAERWREASNAFYAGVGKGLIEPVVGARKVWSDFADWLLTQSEKLGQEEAQRLAAGFVPGVGRMAREAEAALRNANFAAAMDLVGPKLEGGLAVWRQFGEKVEAIGREQGAAAGLAFYNQWAEAVGRKASDADAKILRDALAKALPQDERLKLQIEFEANMEKLAGMSPELAARLKPILQAAYQSALNDLDNAALFERAKKDADTYAKGYTEMLANSDLRSVMAEITGGYVPTDFQEYARVKAEAEQIIQARTEMYAQLRLLDIEFAEYEDDVAAMEAKEQRKTEIMDRYSSQRSNILRKESILERTVYDAAKSMASAMTSSLTASYGQMANGASRYTRAMTALGQAQSVTLANMVGALAQSVAAELTAISAKATVWALWEAAQGVAALARYDFGSAGQHFASAGMFGAIAGGAFLGAYAINAVRPMTAQEESDLAAAEAQKAQQAATGGTATGGAGGSTTTYDAGLPAETQRVVNLNVNFSGHAMLTKAEVAAELDELMRYLDGWRG